MIQLDPHPPPHKKEYDCLPQGLADLLQLTHSGTFAVGCGDHGVSLLSAVRGRGVVDRGRRGHAQPVDGRGGGTVSSGPRDAWRGQGQRSRDETTERLPVG